MDNPELPEDEHSQALLGLARLNRATRIAPAIYKRIRRYALGHGKPLRVLDLASGSGDIPIDWAKRARREGIALKVTGVDISDHAVRFATEQAARANVDVQFMHLDCLSDRLPSGFDVITAGLFMHHLHDWQISRLLMSMHGSAELAVVICDLERSALNLGLVWFAAHSLSRSGIVHRDAVRSVKAALTRHEFREIAEKALDRPVRISGLPPCRFIATIDDVVETVPEMALAGMQAT